MIKSYYVKQYLPFSLPYPLDKTVQLLSSPAQQDQLLPSEKG